MRTILAAFAALSLFAVAGCEVSSPQGGGLASADGFNLVVTHPDLTLYQGEIETINLNVARGGNFKQDVKIDVRADNGIKVDPGNVTVKASDQPSTLIHVSADKTTAVGDYRITIVGTPASGEPTTATITVKVVPS